MKAKKIDCEYGPCGDFAGHFSAEITEFQIIIH